MSPFPCTAILKCLPLPTIADGTISYSGDTSATDGYDVGTMAMFSCNSGLYRTGDSSRVCVEESGIASWNGTSPSCICELPNFIILNAVI